MATGDDIMDIHALRRQGYGVRRYLPEPELKPIRQVRVPQRSKIDPVKPYLLERIRQSAPVRHPAPVYLRELTVPQHDLSVYDELGGGSWASCRTTAAPRSARNSGLSG